MANKILVTGATSSISSAIINKLVSNGHSVQALVRDPQRGENIKALGAELRVGDLEKPLTLNQAFLGVDTAFILTAPTPRAPEQFSNALWAARQSGVRRIVRLSAFGAAHDAPTINGRLHALSDSELMASGLPYTILKPHFFMQNLAMAIKDSIESGVLRFALGAGKLGLIDTNDIAEFAAQILISEGHENNTYTLTGPESISLYEVAAAIGETIGKPIQYEPVPVENALEIMANMGVDEFTLNVLRDYLNAYINNWGDIVSDDFPRIMGKNARNITHFLSDFIGDKY